MLEKVGYFLSGKVIVSVRKAVMLGKVNVGGVMF